MYCANCGKEVAAGKSFCGSCGAPAPTPSDEQPTAPTQPVATARPAASARPETTAGPGPTAAPLAATAPGPTGGPQPPSKRVGLIVFIVALVLVICAGGAIAAIMLLRGGGTPTTTTLTAPLPGAPTTVAGTEVTAAPGGVVDMVDLALRAADIEASSTLADQGPTTYGVENLIDRDSSTCWAEGVSGYGVNDYVDFTWTNPVTVYEVRIVPGYDKTASGWDRWTSNGRVRTFDLVFSDGTRESFTVTDTKPPQTLTLSAPHTTTLVEFVITGYFEAAAGPHKAEDTSVAELHFWGTE